MIKYLRPQWWASQTLGVRLTALAFNVLTLFALNTLLEAYLPQHDGFLLANTLLTIEMVTFEALRILENQLGIAGRVNREYSDQFARSGAKIGDTLNIRKPPRYRGRTGDEIQPESTTETSVPLVLDTLFGVDVEFSGRERTLSLDDYSRRILRPQIATIANKIDDDVFQVYKKVFNQVGSPGTTPSSLTTYLDAGVKLKNEAAPLDGLCMGVNPQMEATIVAAAVGYFNPTRQISDQYLKGEMGRAAGFEWFMDQNAPVHTAATQSGTITINGAVGSGSSVTVASLTTTGLKEGDTFTVADVYAVNPQNRRSTGQLRQFRVAADTGADTAGALTFSFEPAVVTSGAFQNVSQAMAHGAQLTFQASTGRVYQLGMAFHPDFCTLATADLEIPNGVHKAARVADQQTGLSIRMIEDYDIRSNKTYSRLDVLYGIKVLYPELACRVAGGSAA